MLNIPLSISLCVSRSDPISLCLLAWRGERDRERKRERSADGEIQIDQGMRETEKGIFSKYLVTPLGSPLESPAERLLCHAIHRTKGCEI